MCAGLHSSHANRPLVLRGTSSLRVSKSSCEDTAYGSRPLVCDHSVCLSARPTKIAVTHRSANWVQQAGGIYGALLELAADAMITSDEEGLIQESNGEAVLYLLMQKERP